MLSYLLLPALPFYLKKYKILLVLCPTKKTLCLNEYFLRSRDTKPSVIPIIITIITGIESVMDINIAI